MTTPRWVVVDDVDSAINYTGPWFQDQGTQDSVGNFGPAYRSTLHGTKNNASLSFAFTGTSVRVYGTNNIRNDSGVLDPTWDCFVDNISIGPSTPFQYPENNWLFCSQNNLVDGPHILTVNATVTKAQTFWFDSVQYVPSASVSLADAAVMVDSLDPQLQYGEGWQALGSTANLTTQTSSIFTFDFTGISLSWYGFIPREYPLTATTSTYSVDGGDPVNFLLKGLPPNTATTYNQRFFETTKLTAGQHKLVVTYLGDSKTTPLTLDYLIVQNGTAASGGGNTSHKSNNIGAIVGGVVGGVVLIALAIFAFLYIRRRDKRLSEEQPAEPKTIEPFHYLPVSTSTVPPPSHNHSSSVVTYPQVQSGDAFGLPGHSLHGSMPSFGHTDIQSIIPSGSSSSGGTRPNPLQPMRNHGHNRFPSSSDLSTPASSNAAQYVPYNPAGDKAQREAAATAAVVQSRQRNAQQPLASPPLSDDSGSRVILHEDSGIRLPQTSEPQVVEVPPVYTPG